MNQRDLIILESASRALKEELENLVNMSVVEEWEQTWSYEDALEHVEDLDWPEFKRPALLVRIALGDYQPISEEKCREIVANSYGVKMSHFPKVKGQRYDWVK